MSLPLWILIVLLILWLLAQEERRATILRDIWGRDTGCLSFVVAILILVWLIKWMMTGEII